MAYFFGMYVNGIAVYGRDPVLTCQYARFISEDQHCPATFYSDQSISVSYSLLDFAARLFSSSIEDDLNPSEWRNCSSKGYHP